LNKKLNSNNNQNNTPTGTTPGPGIPNPGVPVQTTCPGNLKLFTRNNDYECIDCTFPNKDSIGYSANNCNQENINKDWNKTWYDSSRKDRGAGCNDSHDGSSCKSGLCLGITFPDSALKYYNCA